MSPDAPLISNLSIWENVALIIQYHRRASRAAAFEQTCRLLGRLDCRDIAFKRNPALREKERFCVLLLRAAVMNDAVIIDRPFMLVPTATDAAFIFDGLDALENVFTECFLFDYEWNRSKYGPDHAEAC